MASALDERILDLAVTKFGTITTANGYEQTVAGVHRPPTDLFDLKASDCPFYILRKRRRTSVSHLRRGEDFEIELEVLCGVDGSLPDLHEALADMIADAKKLVDLNRLWHDGVENLARWTRLMEDRIHDVEVPVDVASAVVKFLIGARADLANPYVTKPTA